MKKKYIKLLVIILPLLVITPLTFSNKEVKKEKEIAIKEPSLPGGIVAYTLNGEKTNVSYNDLIEGYEIDSITCKNGTIATYNKEDNSVSLSNIHMPDYCTMDFKLGTYTVTIDAGGGYFGNPTEIDDGFSDALTLAKGVSVPVHAGNTLNLTPNQKYMLSFDYWSDEGSVGFDVDLYPDNLPEILPVATTTQQTMNWIFSSSSSDMTSCRIRYFNDRSVPNPQNITIINKHLYKCDDCRLTYTKEVTKGNAYGDLNAPKRYGWDFLGWYLEDGTKVESTSINNIKGDHTVTAKWSHHNYEVKLVGVNGTIEYAPIWYYMAGWEKAYTKITPNSGYTTSGATVSCTGSAGASISGDYLYLSNITEDQTCTVTFKGITLLSKLLSDNSTISTRTDFSTTFTTTNTGTLYTSTESIAGSAAKTVYYFAGNATNNWVKIGGFYWRIIRTNHDGSVRLLYAGTSPDTTEGYIGKSAFNSTSTDALYVGYMYGTTGTLASNRTNENDSTIKGVIDTWYSNNLSSYAKYISTEAVYCNDRKAPSYNASSSFDYYVYTRLSAGNPTYDCTDTKDAFSGSNSEAKLTYPIGLMTADEISYAGGVYGTSLTSPYAWYYLNSAEGSITKGTWWWLLSPRLWSGYKAILLHVSGSGAPGTLGDSHRVADSGAVRPVISIKSDALWSSGNGSSSSPYEIVYN